MENEFETNGIDELMNKFNDLQEDVDDLDDVTEIPFSELFTEDFMNDYSGFNTFAEMLEAGGFQAKSKEEFQALSCEELDKHIAETTDFDSWDEMLAKAVEEYIHQD